MVKIVFLTLFSSIFSTFCFSSEADNSWIMANKNPQNLRSVEETFVKFTKIDELTFPVKYSDVTTSTLIEDGIIYFGTKNYTDNPKNILAAYDLETKNILWKFDLADNNNSSPVIAGDYLVFLTSSRYLMLNKKTGKIVWEFPVLIAQKGRGTDPIIHDGKVIFGDDTGEVRFLDPVNKKIIWSFKAIAAITGAPAVYKNELIVASKFGLLYRLDLATGQQKGVVTCEGFTGSPVVFNDYLLTTDGRGIVTVSDLVSGKRIWSRRLDEQLSTVPVTDGDSVFINSIGYGVFGLDFDNGKDLWRTETPVILSSPILLKDTLIVNSMTGKLFAMDVKTGAVKDTFQHNGMSISSPSYSDGYLVFGSVVYKEEDRKVQYPVIYILKVK